MDFEMNTASAPMGSIEHYRHYMEEFHSLHALVIKTLIKDRSELAFLLDGVKMVLGEYEDLM